MREVEQPYIAYISTTTSTTTVYSFWPSFGYGWSFAEGMSPEFSYSRRWWQPPAFCMGFVWCDLLDTCVKRTSIEAAVEVIH